MTQDEIKELAYNAGFSIANGILIGGITDLKRFAKLVAAKEREASAKELDEISKEAKNIAPNGYVWRTIKECAEAIRARGEA